MSDHYSILIVGGGTAGITVAAQLAARADAPTLGLIEPSDRHYYQPIWTLVGGGVFPREISVRNEEDFIPAGVDWIRDAVTTFEPEQNAVRTKGGKRITYDNLIVAAGISINWGRIRGLEGNVGKNGICSNYSFDTVNSTWDTLRTMRSGHAVFTHPDSSIKCGGAPQKIMYLAEHYFRRQGVRDDVTVSFYKAGAGIFGVEKYKKALEKIVEARDIDTHFNRDLIEVRPDKKEAIFRDLTGGKDEVVKYDMLHITPPQGAPKFIAQSPLAGDGGWVAVNKDTLQHDRYPNVFSLGDCSSLPTAKTGAAVRKQAPVLVANLMAYRAGKALPKTYNGYTSCPLVTGYGRLIMAEFDYNDQPAETFPFDQGKERYSMYALKAYALPDMYWHGMLRGRM
jgi:sulfide:quinone oxidoreductase